MRAMVSMRARSSASRYASLSGSLSFCDVEQKQVITGRMVSNGACQHPSSITTCLLRAVTSQDNKSGSGGTPFFFRFCVCFVAVICFKVCLTPTLLVFSLVFADAIFLQYKMRFYAVVARF
jgi:hypothetical protein